MNILIIYGTTYGYAEDCAKSLAMKLNGQITCVNIIKENAPSLDKYDIIIIGGSIYMGQIQRKVKEYCKQNIEKLLTKRLGLFICCSFPENFEAHLQSSFPNEILEKATSKECFGGELRIQRMSFFHRFITNIVSKSAAKEGKGEVVTLPQNIDKMAQVINNIKK